METARLKCLEKIEKCDKNFVAKDHCSLKETSKMDSNTVTINGVTIRSRVIEIIRERDGVKLPYIIRQVFCEPAAPLDMLRKHISFKENILGKEREIFYQFLEDS